MGAIKEVFNSLLLKELLKGMSVTGQSNGMHGRSCRGDAAGARAPAA